MTNKEIDKINTEIRSRRAVLASVEESIKISTSHHHKLTDEICSLNDQVKELTANVDIIHKSNYDKKIELDKNTSLLAGEKHEHLKNVNAFLDAKSKMEEYGRRVSRNEHEVNIRNADLKKERIRLDMIQKELNDKEIFLNNRKLELDIIKDDINDKDLEAQNQKKDNFNLKEYLDKKNEDIINRKNILLDEIKIHEENVKNLKDFEMNINSKSLELSNKENELKEKQVELEKNYSSLDNDRISHRRNVEDLKNYENKLKVKELRVSKLITDNKISNDLKTLEGQAKLPIPLEVKK